MTARLLASSPPGTLALLKAARDELDAIAGRGIPGDVDAGDLHVRLDAVAGLIEEAMAEIEGQP